MVLLAFFLQVVFFTLFTFTLPVVISQGLTFDECTSQQDCASPRRCMDSGRPCEGISGCVCVPLLPNQCLSDDACPEGERCVVLKGTQGSSPPFCVSIEAARSTITVPVESVTQPNPTEGSVTGAGCLRNSDCLAPRICVKAQTGFELCVGTGSVGCICVPPVFQECEDDGDCPAGESCGLEGNPICVEGGTGGRVKSIPKPTAASDPDFVEDVIENGADGNSSSNGTVVVTREVCVAERHLKGVKGIYENGRLARVLCDSQGSCATGGHLVVYHGQGMMMRRYCVVVGCTESIMKVNSPRWERGLRVNSWSDGLVFTAFAARYETVAEEMVLAGVVRAGF